MKKQIVYVFYIFILICGISLETLAASVSFHLKIEDENSKVTIKKANLISEARNPFCADKNSPGFNQYTGFAWAVATHSTPLTVEEKEQNVFSFSANTGSDLVCWYGISSIEVDAIANNQLGAFPLKLTLYNWDWEKHSRHKSRRHTSDMLIETKCYTIVESSYEVANELRRWLACDSDGYSGGIQYNSTDQSIKTLFNKFENGQVRIIIDSSQLRSDEEFRYKNKESK